MKPIIAAEFLAHCLVGYKLRGVHPGGKLDWGYEASPEGLNRYHEMQKWERILVDEPAD